MVSLSPLRHTNPPDVCMVRIVCDALISLVTLTFDLHGYPCDGLIHPSNFGLPRPFRYRVRSRHATDRHTDGQTDRHRDNAPSLEGRGITRAPPQDFGEVVTCI